MILDTQRATDERLRTALNSDQLSRERLCVAVLAMDRNYSDVQPRRPSGGPDGGRDIQCQRQGETCFGAVGFVNSASDSAANKRTIRKKFESDLASALAAMPELRSFVFFTNVDLTPKEVQALEEYGQRQNVTFVDVYWRERVRISLDSPEGLSTRFQLLGIELSQAEQASFFSRFGADLNQLIQGRMGTLEKRIDDLELLIWKDLNVRNLILEIQLAKGRNDPQSGHDHFRVLLELQSIPLGNNIVLGGRDEYHAAESGWYLGTKTLFWRETAQGIDPWVPHRGPRAWGGWRETLQFGVQWKPPGAFPVVDLQRLVPRLYVTENLADKITQVEFQVDSYIFARQRLHADRWEKYRPHFVWPDALTEHEQAVGWRCYELGARFDLETLPQRIGRTE